MTKIYDLLRYSDSIKDHIDDIEKVLRETEYSDSGRTSVSHAIRSRVQAEAGLALAENNTWGCIYIATGVGKSKIAINAIANLDDSYQTPDKCLIVVPTEKLRDENWMEEFIKWDMLTHWEHTVQRCCYASLNKYKNEHFDLVILDEGHNITENNSEFFRNNTVHGCILLTATKPRDPIKLQILKDLKLNPVYELSLDESVKLGLVSPYDITIVTMQLDTRDKYIPAGSKAKPFMNTEKGQYGYLSKRLSAMPNQKGFINRMRFIYNLKSKTQAAKWLLENAIPKDLKTLIFSGSKNQADSLCEHRFYSKPSPPKKLDENKRYTPLQLVKYEKAMKEYRESLPEFQGDKFFNKFKDGSINRLSCVNALNEGHNIAMMDIAFIVQLDSNQQNFIQRIGRTLRFRAGHRGKIIILCCEDTVDKDWVAKATVSLSTANITTVKLVNLQMEIEKLLFD